MYKRNNLLRRMALLLAAILCLVSGFTAAFAMDYEPADSKSCDVTMSETVRIVEGGTVTIDGQVYELYPVFSDQAAAMSSIRAQVPELLKTLAKTYHLAPMSDKNWQDYRLAMMRLLDEPDRPEGYNASNEDFIALNSFFDIYENAKKNERIMEYVSSSAETQSLSIEKLKYLLPYSNFAQ